MSQPFRFKVKLPPSLARQPSQSTGGAAPSQNQGQQAAIPEQREGNGAAAATAAAAAVPAGPPAPERKVSIKSIKLKLPGAAGGGAAGAAAAAGAGGAAGAPAPKRPADQPAAGAAAPKKIKLTVPVGATGAGGAPKPKIRLKTAGSLPPKQPRAGGELASALSAPPVIRLTLPPGAAAAAAGAGGTKKLPGQPRMRKGTGAGAGKPPGGGAKKPRRAAKQQVLLPEEADDDDDDLEGGPLIPRAPSARHAAAAATTVLSELSGGSRSLGEEVGMLVDEEDGDVAFTDAPQAMAPVQQPGGAASGAPPPLPMLSSLPEGGPPAKREDLERVVRLVQRKDHHAIFKEPVTEEVAPGYFKVIKEPMDFTTMKGKLERGEYVTYEDLQRDLRLMFLNAMTYNPPDSPFFAHARTMLFSAEKLVEQARQGVLSQRQAAGEARKQNAQLRAQERAARDALRAAARAEQKAAQEAKVLKKAGVGDHHEESLDESIRNSYRRPLRDVQQARWRGLGGGATADGAALGWGRQILRPAGAQALSSRSYASSLARFAAGLKGKARDMVSARAAATVPNPDAASAERLLNVQLARKPPPPPPPPVAVPVLPTAPGPTAVGSAAGGVGAGPALGTMQVPLFNPMLLQQMQQAAARPAAPGATMLKQPPLGGQPAQRPPSQIPAPLTLQQQQAMFMQQLAAQQAVVAQQAVAAQRPQQPAAPGVRHVQGLAPSTTGMLPQIQGLATGIAVGAPAGAVAWPAAQQQQLLRPGLLQQGAVAPGMAMLQPGASLMGLAVPGQPQQLAAGQPVATAMVAQQLQQQQQQQQQVLPPGQPR